MDIIVFIIIKSEITLLLKSKILIGSCKIICPIITADVIMQVFF